MSNVAIILAAGKGTRMRSSTPKVMHNIAHKPMVQHVVDEALKICDETLLILAPHMQEVTDHYHGSHPIYFQSEQLGTAHAVNSAKEHFTDLEANILILYGDVPLITEQTMLKMTESLTQGSDISVLGFKAKNPFGYGRLITNDTNQSVNAIVEEKDANEAQRSIDLCNSGLLCVKSSLLFKLIEQVDNNNASGEYYLTDIIKHANSQQLKTSYIIADEDEVLGVNDRYQLSQAELIYQNRLRKKHMVSGVTLQSPETTFFAYDTVIGNDSIIEPNVYFGTEVTIGASTHVKAFSHIEKTTIGNGCNIGPFARIRPGTSLGDEVGIGNFVEIKNSKLDNHVKAGHLSYLGDSDIGTATNIGAGTITCNYNGYKKFRTTIGSHVFVGSNSAIVAPVTIEDNSLIAAGSTITKDVSEDAMAIGRGKQKNIDQGAAQFRRSQES